MGEGTRKEQTVEDTEDSHNPYDQVVAGEGDVRQACEVGVAPLGPYDAVPLDDEDNRANGE